VRWVDLAKGLWDQICASHRAWLGAYANLAVLPESKYATRLAQCSIKPLRLLADIGIVSSKKHRRRSFDRIDCIQHQGSIFTFWYQLEPSSVVRLCDLYRYAVVVAEDSTQAAAVYPINQSQRFRLHVGSLEHLGQGELRPNVDAVVVWLNPALFLEELLPLLFMFRRGILRIRNIEIETIPDAPDLLRINTFSSERIVLSNLRSFSKGFGPKT
jgi:hypothetical protein